MNQEEYKECVETCMRYAYTFAIMRGYPRHIVVTKDLCRDTCAQKYLSEQVKRISYKLKAAV